MQLNTSQESPILDELEELEDGLPPILDERPDWEENENEKQLDYKNDLDEHNNDLEAETPKVGIILRRFFC